MIFIFFGYILLFFNINIMLGNGGVLTLLPDFVGYLMILSGLRELFAQSDWFIKLESITKKAVVYTGIIFFLNIVSYSILMNLKLIFAAVSMWFLLYITLHIIKGIAEIEEKKGLFLGSKHLQGIWKVMLILNVSEIVVYLFPMAVVLLAIGVTIVDIVFLVVIHKAEKTLEAEEKREKEIIEI